MSKKRTENDFLGSMSIPAGALYGIHSLRAKENFPRPMPFNKQWYKAIALVKLAMYQTSLEFYKAVDKKYPGKELPLRGAPKEVLDLLVIAAEQAATGEYYEHFIVPAISGGAGTSMNMNMNEILANAALLQGGHQPGEYSKIDPVEDANIFQSTNDVIPTSLKVAAMKLLVELEESVNLHREEMEKIEGKTRNWLRLAYTQMQEAVPSTYGRLFSTYNEALSRDWWRVSKCLERIKVVNLGGSAVGTGITVPKYIIMEGTRTLQKLTGLPVTRSENLGDATANQDSLVEVHAILKAHAVNLEKTVNDIRILSSDLLQNKEVNIPARQMGSSIMPSKVNPVIPEYVISVAHEVYANDQLISSLASQGMLDLNAYLPVIGNALLESIELLIAANQTMKGHLVKGIQIDGDKAYRKLVRSPSITTALVPYIGYNKASELAKCMRENQLDVFGANKELNFMDEKRLAGLLEPRNLVKEGFTIKDII